MSRQRPGAPILQVVHGSRTDGEVGVLRSKQEDMSTVGTQERRTRLREQELERPGFQVEASQSSKARDEQAAIGQKGNGEYLFPSPGSKSFTSPVSRSKTRTISSGDQPRGHSRRFAFRYDRRRLSRRTLATLAILSKPDPATLQDQHASRSCPGREKLAVWRHGQCRHVNAFDEPSMWEAVDRREAKSRRRLLRDAAAIHFPFGSKATSLGAGRRRLAGPRANAG